MYIHRAIQALHALTMTDEHPGTTDARRQREGAFNAAEGVVDARSFLMQWKLRQNALCTGGVVSFWNPWCVVGRAKPTLVAAMVSYRRNIA